MKVLRLYREILFLLIRTNNNNKYFDEIRSLNLSNYFLIRLIRTPKTNKINKHDWINRIRHSVLFLLRILYSCQNFDCTYISLNSINTDFREMILIDLLFQLSLSISVNILYICTSIVCIFTVLSTFILIE